MFSNWTDRIAAGEVPAAPPRPQGLERNIVITQWNWGDAKTYLHDEVSTDRRNPTVNANGLLYGSPELSSESLPVLDPVTGKTWTIQLPPPDPKLPRAASPVLKPSPYWGDEAIWTSRSDVHNPMFDGQGRLWVTARVRTPATPAFCREGSTHPSAKRFPIKEGTNVEFRSEFFNIFNHANFANPSSTLNSALPSMTFNTAANAWVLGSGIQPGQAFTQSSAGTAFGLIRQTVERTVGLGTNRQIQFALRLNF